MSLTCQPTVTQKGDPSRIPPPAISHLYNCQDTGHLWIALLKRREITSAPEAQKKRGVFFPLSLKRLKQMLSGSQLAGVLGQIPYLLASVLPQPALKTHYQVDLAKEASNIWQAVIKKICINNWSNLSAVDKSIRSVH